MLSCQLKVSGAGVRDSAGTRSNLSYTLIMLNPMLNLSHFVSGLQVKSGE